MTSEQSYRKDEGADEVPFQKKLTNDDTPKLEKQVCSSEDGAKISIL